MSFQWFGGFETGIPSLDDVQARLAFQAGLLTNVIGGLYAPLDSAMTYQAAQLAGPVKALKSAATRSVNGVAKALAPIGDTLDTVIATQLGEQGGSLASMQGSVAAAAALQSPLSGPSPPANINIPNYGLPGAPAPAGTGIVPSASTTVGSFLIYYQCDPTFAAMVAPAPGTANPAEIPSPQSWTPIASPIFADAAEANAYLQDHYWSLLDLCGKPTPNPTPDTTPTPVLVPPPVQPMPDCADPQWLLGAINTPGKAVVGSPVFTVNGYAYYYGGPSPYAFSPYMFVGASLANPGVIDANSTAYLDICKPIVPPIGSPPPPTPVPIGSPPPPTPTPCCPDWDDLLKKLCKCLHAIHVGQQPVDLDQPLAFLFGEQAARWHPKAVAFYGQGLQDIIDARTLQGLIELRESQEGQ